MTSVAALISCCRVRNNDGEVYWKERWVSSYNGHPCVWEGNISVLKNHTFNKVALCTFKHSKNVHLFPRSWSSAVLLQLQALALQSSRFDTTQAYQQNALTHHRHHPAHPRPPHQRNPDFPPSEQPAVIHRRHRRRSRNADRRLLQCRSPVPGRPGHFREHCRSASTKL